MAEAEEDSFEVAIHETSKVLSQYASLIYLKPEQKVAIKSLVCGKDVLAVLPTGFGKSAIYQFLVHPEKISNADICFDTPATNQLV